MTTHLYGNEPECAICGHYGPDSEDAACLTPIDAGERIHKLRRDKKELDSRLAAHRDGAGKALELLAEAGFNVSDGLLPSIQAAIRERNAYKKAKSENDDRFMGERDEARDEVGRLKELLKVSDGNNEVLKSAVLEFKDDAVQGIKKLKEEIEGLKKERDDFEKENKKDKDLLRKVMENINVLGVMKEDINGAMDLLSFSGGSLTERVIAVLKRLSKSEAACASLRDALEACPSIDPTSPAGARGWVEKRATALKDDAGQWLLDEHDAWMKVVEKFEPDWKGINCAPWTLLEHMLDEAIEALRGCDEMIDQHGNTAQCARDTEILDKMKAVLEKRPPKEPSFESIALKESHSRLDEIEKDNKKIYGQLLEAQEKNTRLGLARVVDDGEKLTLEERISVLEIVCTRLRDSLVRAEGALTLSVPGKEPHSTSIIGEARKAILLGNQALIKDKALEGWEIINDKGESEIVPIDRDLVRMLIKMHDETKDANTALFDEVIIEREKVQHLLVAIRPVLDAGRQWDPQAVSKMRRATEDVMAKGFKPDKPSNTPLNPDDDGVLVFRTVVDPEKRVLIVDFGKQVKWIALDLVSLNMLIENFGNGREKLKALG